MLSSHMALRYLGRRPMYAGGGEHSTDLSKLRELGIRGLILAVDGFHEE